VKFLIKFCFAIVTSGWPTGQMHFCKMLL